MEDDSALKDVEKATILIIEPFYTGSHKQLIDDLVPALQKKYKVLLYTLPGKKWHWRARTSALYFVQTVPHVNCNVKTLFCSSVLNLTELLGMRPDLMACVANKIVYFHENQLVYPVREAKERDFQYGYNQITTCLAADKVLFNSQYNLTSFVQNIGSFLKLQPDFRPDKEQLVSSVEKKSSVVYFPVNLPEYGTERRSSSSADVLHIVWPHRWEHDKDPETFFRVLFKLKDEQLNFKVSVLGETFEDVPEIFATAEKLLGEKHLVHFGRLESKQDYLQVLSTADVVVSTALHEFFGVAVIEAASSGCLPLLPERLVYPEIYSTCRQECLYRTEQQLFKKLRLLCRKPHLAQTWWTKSVAEQICSRFSRDTILEQFANILCP